MSFKITIPPGIVKSNTPHGVMGRWTDGDMVRFVAGRPEKMAGWTKWVSGEQTIGQVRGMRGWISVDLERYVTVGTYIKAYAISDTFDDITPLRTSGTLGSDPLTTSMGDETVTVAHTSHGISEDGAYIELSGATAVGGITPDGEYFATYADANSYTIEHSSAATSGATGGGSSVDYEYQINPGQSDTTYGLGYGAGPYGAEEYGVVRTGVTGIQLEARIWSIAKYGAGILIAPSGGTLYEWDEVTPAARAVAVSNAPSSMRAFFVSAEGFVVALGTSTDMTIAWPDRDDNTDWTPTVVNTANVRTLRKGNKIIHGAAVSDVNLIWTDNAVYLMQYLGDTEIIYDTRVVSEGTGLIGPLAFAVAGQPAAAYWLAASGFYMFTGGFVRPIPNQMDIRDYVLDNMDRSYAYKFWGAYNPSHDEIWFGYVTDGNTQPDRIVILNLQDFSWSIGALARNGMTFFPTPLQEVVAAGTDRYIYQHEIGLNADGSTLNSYIKSGMLEIDEGDVDMDIVRYIHDVERQSGPMALTLDVYERPNSQAALETETFTVQPTDETADMMMGGRYARFEVRSNVASGDFRLGVPLFTVQRGGDR